MAIANRLQSYLKNHAASFDIVSHPYSERALDTAHQACIPSRAMTKAVVLRDEAGLVMAIMPAHNKLMLGWINLSLNRKLVFVGEHDLKELFPDCQPGAVPAMGMAYGMSSVWDDQLDTVTDVYIEAGNHRELVHMQREQFQKLLKDQPHAAISCDRNSLEAFQKF